MTRTTSTDDNYHKNHRYTTIPEAEHHTDHSREITLTITHIVEIIDTIKDIVIRIITITIEAEAIIETIIIEVELTVTTEIIITNTTITDRVQDIQTTASQDNIHHTTEILIIITVTIIDKDIIVKIQTKATDTDNDQVVTIDNILIIIITIIGVTEDTQRKENKMIDIIQKTEEQTEINTTITTKTE